MMSSFILYVLKIIFSLRLLLVLFSTFLIVLLLLISSFLNRLFHFNYYLVKIWGYVTLKFFFFKIVKKNVDADLLGFYIAPHSSFWDIVLLSSLVKGYFVSKAEVKKWPLIGLGTRLIKTIFIEREKKVRAYKCFVEGARELLEKFKYSVIVFPEGTRVVNHMSYFKNGVFLVAKELNYPIIPVLINYSPSDLFYKPKKLNFIKEIFFQAFSFKRPKVYVEFLEPIYPSKFSSVESFKEHVFILMDSRYKQIEKLTKLIF